MLRKGLFFAAAALGAFAVSTAANAQPASIGRTLQLNNTAFISVDYDYRGYYGYHRDYYGDGILGLFKIPGAVLGGVAELLSGGASGTYYDDSYYPRPYYQDPYYSSLYRGSYYDRPYNERSYYFSPRYVSRQYYDDHRNYDDRRYFSHRDYDGDRGYYRDRYYDDRYYGDRAGAYEYYGNPRYGDTYDRPRASFDTDDDDD